MVTEILATEGEADRVKRLLRRSELVVLKVEGLVIAVPRATAGADSATAGLDAITLEAGGVPTLALVL